MNPDDGNESEKGRGEIQEVEKPVCLLCFCVWEKHPRPKSGSKRKMDRAMRSHEN